MPYPRPPVCRTKVRMVVTSAGQVKRTQDPIPALKPLSVLNWRVLCLPDSAPPVDGIIGLPDESGEDAIPSLW
jgi:hypothetical protein